MSQNPYEKYVAGDDAVAALADTARQIATITGEWPADVFERSYAPGKWSARQILVHLAQMEMVFATRLRFALAHDDYVVQPFDQDSWMAVEERGDGKSALDAYLALRRMSLTICRDLTADQRARTVRHPEFGTIDVEWILVQVAGHERHHLGQLREVANERR